MTTAAMRAGSRFGQRRFMTFGSDLEYRRKVNENSEVKLPVEISTGFDIPRGYQYAWKFQRRQLQRVNLKSDLS